MRAVRRALWRHLTRVPRGYPADHPAADFLRHKQFIAGRELPAEAATRDDFYRELLATFKADVPLVRFLNEPLWRVTGPGTRGSRRKARFSAALGAGDSMKQPQEKNRRGPQAAPF